VDTKLVIGLVAAGATVLGGVIAHLSAVYQARTKLRELHLAYEQKLQDTYLTNARQYTNNLYVPLSVLMSRLRRAFDHFRRSFDSAAAPGTAVVEFTTAVNTFVEDLDTLLSRGAGAFLTAPLERKLDSFREFLRGSVGATGPVTRMIFHYQAGFGGLNVDRRFTTAARPSRLMAVAGQSFSVGMFGFGFGYTLEAVLEAPFGTKEFDTQMEQDLAELAALVKEVTLGARSQPA
jgi:hypothetical protein